MPVDAWDPALYARFAAERAQPFFDLLALVEPAPELRVADLGCGTGELTARLHGALAAARTVGVDRSPAMRAGAGELAGVELVAGDLADWAPDGPLDLVFSNAALHWVDDHPALLARLAGWLAPGGQLAVQVPANHAHPSQTVALEVAAEAPFAEALGGWVRRSPVLDERAYAERLEALGFAEQHVAARIYRHHLPDRRAVVDWVRGTTLTVYRERLPAELAARFEAVYAERLLERLEDATPYPFFFRRILIWGRLPG